MNRILSTLLASTLIAAMPQANAVPVVDQNYTGRGLTSILAEGQAYTGQSVTAGLTGYLVRVELAASRRSTFIIPWILDIQEVIAGVPTGNILSTTVIDPTDFPINTGYEPWLLADLSSPVFFEAGDTFAIVLHPQGVEGSPGLFAGGWSGGCTSSSTFCYSGGRSFSGRSANALVARGYDLSFKTFVSQVPVPEPATFVLMFTALAGLAMVRRVNGKE